MLVGFDCQGTIIGDSASGILEERYPSKILVPLIRHLALGGAEIHIISSCPKGHPTSYETLVKLMSWNRIPIHGIWPAWAEPDHQPFDVGLNKARIMYEIGCDVMFDDLPEVCEGIRSAGKIAILYSMNMEAHLHHAK